MSREVRRIAYVQHKLRKLPGDSVHTRIFLDASLGHTYKRDTVIIYANVVRATHGETVRQVLGSGDASKAFQQFPLAKAPLTYLAAATPSGVASTLAVKVNNLLWHEKETLLDSEANSRDYVVHADEYWKSTVQFGDGTTGARLPTGRENVRGEYRVGLGIQGNVKAGTITQPANRSLGVKEVNNPLPATGGADPETVEQIRANAPLAVMALDRLVSTHDYGDFARNYAGIDKARAKRVLLGGQPTVHVTIAGAGDVPIDDNSDLFINLRKAFIQLGDPLQAVNVQVRELLLLFISARVRIEADYAWVEVEPRIRTALYDAFSFARGDLAQDVYLSELASVIQHVKGVAYVDVDVFDALAQKKFKEALLNSTGQAAPQDGASDSTTSESPLQEIVRTLREPSEIPTVPVADIRVERDDEGRLVIRPAQLAYLSREVPDSLFLKEITP
jgi:predicted phage baseplate assembly protein